MTQQLRASGLLGGGVVTGLVGTPVGNGMVGTSIRYVLEYNSAEPGAPASLVGKFPAQDSVSRQSGAGLRLYLRETSFYRLIAPTVAIRTPAVIVNHFDPDTHDFVLLFEDLTPARGGDQLCGCAPEDAATAMREIAGLHAPYWNSRALDAMDWLALPDQTASAIADMLPGVTQIFQDRYDGRLEPEVMRAAARMAPLGRAIMFNTPLHRTVLHGDFRLDNVLFEPKGGAWPMATLDWQTAARGCGTQDAAYFLGAGLRAADRAAHETELLHIYHERLLSFGVQDYGWEQCWADYCKHSLNGLFMAVLSAISVSQTDRGDEMFLAMARRHAAQVLELGAFDLWR